MKGPGKTGFMPLCTRTLPRMRKSLLILFFFVTCGVIAFINSGYNARGNTMETGPEIGGPCNASFASSLDDNILVVKSYPTAGAQPYLEKLGLFKPYVRPTRRVPVIATASSANHFYESLVLIENIQEKLLPFYPELEIHYYDIGLWASQVERLKKFPRTHVYRFPFEDFPEHVSNIKGYTWKPLIIQMELEKYGFVLWVDASIRFEHPNINQVFDIARTQGICYREGGLPMTPHTDLDTFRFLGEEECLFDKFNEIEANFICVYKTELMRSYVIKPWVTCALQPGCMVTEHSSEMYKCTDIKHRGMCHRFDQAVISLILSRLFSQNLTSLYVPHGSGVSIHRSFTIPFLPETINRLIIRAIDYFEL